MIYLAVLFPSWYRTKVGSMMSAMLHLGVALEVFCPSDDIYNAEASHITS